MWIVEPMWYGGTAQYSQVRRRKRVYIHIGSPMVTNNHNPPSTLGFNVDLHGFLSIHGQNHSFVFTRTGIGPNTSQAAWSLRYYP